MTDFSVLRCYFRTGAAKITHVEEASTQRKYKGGQPLDERLLWLSVEENNSTSTHLSARPDFLVGLAFVGAASLKYRSTIFLPSR